MPEAKTHHLALDFFIIIISGIIAFVLAKTGIFENILTSTQGLKFIGSFVAGIFFTSAVTTLPAAVALGEIAQETSILTVAFFGGLGALLGDFLLFRFIRDSIAEDFIYLLQKTGPERWLGILDRRLFRWLTPFVGALIIASPLPDEVGLAMMGLSKVKTSIFIPVSFSLNFLGILVIGLIARSLLQ
mgnify:CR=1 FL=1